MYYIYLIQNKANKGLYYGYTIDLRRKLKEHNENGEWELIYYKNTTPQRTQENGREN
jgi:predicted GIY-YIG superfamily endonuclease